MYEYCRNETKVESLSNICCENRLKHKNFRISLRVVTNETIHLVGREVRLNIVTFRPLQWPLSNWE